MKTIINIQTKTSITSKVATFMLLVGMIFLFVFLASCGGDSASASEVNTKKLTAHAWKVSSVTVNSTDQTALYTGMTLSFTNTNYSTTNADPVWTSGTWTFADSKATIIMRNDGLEASIVELTDATLKLSLTWNKNTFEPGRVSSISGNHVFTLVK